MTREELEAIVWRNATNLIFGGEFGRAAAIEDILTAADRYAGALIPVPVRHYDVGTLAACAKPATPRQLTTDRDQVTCGRCKRTRGWQNASLTTTTGGMT